MWDNSQLPGSGYEYHNTQQGMASGFGTGETPYDDSKRSISDYDNVNKIPNGGDKTPLIQRKDKSKNRKYVDMIKKRVHTRAKLEGASSMKPIVQRAAERQKRFDSIYSMEEDYAAYGRYCAKPTCVGVWKELLGYDARKKLNIDRVSEVWKCPKCEEVTNAMGSISDQTSGFSSYDTYNNGPIEGDDDFEPTKISPDKDRTKR
jgi:hypothetical protein